MPIGVLSCYLQKLGNITNFCPPPYFLSRTEVKLCTYFKICATKPPFSVNMF